METTRRIPFLSSFLGTMFMGVALMLSGASPVATAAPLISANTVFKHYAGTAESLKPRITPGDARSSPYSRTDYSDATWEWEILGKDRRYVGGVKVQISIVMTSASERSDAQEAIRRIMVQCKCTRSEAAALFREARAFESVTNSSYSMRNNADYRIGASSPMLEDFRSEPSVDPFKFVASRKSRQLGNFNYVYFDRLEKLGKYKGRFYSAGNVRLFVYVTGEGPDPEEIAYDILAKLSGGGNAPPKQDDDDRLATDDREPPRENIRIEAYPRQNINIDNVALIPAGSNFPARITVYTGTATKGKDAGKLVFRIASGAGGELRAGSARGQTLTLPLAAGGRTVAYFHYIGEAALSAPTRFKIEIEEGKRKAEASVVAGLGLGFQNTRYVKGDFKSGTYPLALKIQSQFHPNLNLGAFLQEAEQSGVWGGNKVGVKLCVEWVNQPDQNRNCSGYRGTGHLAFTGGAGEAFIAGDNDPIYYMNNFSYPAVQLSSPGKYIYRVNAVMAAVDGKGGEIRETSGEPRLAAPLITIATDDNPESWYQSLACSFQAQDVVQYALLETAKKIPVYGEGVEAFSTATSLACKLVQGQYESAFYDLGTVLGGEYLKHLVTPEVFSKLTEKQQIAVKLAKESYDQLSEVQKKQEREEVIRKTLTKYGYANRPVEVGIPDNPLVNETESLRRQAEESAISKTPAAPQAKPGAPQAPTKSLDEAAKELQKSFNELGGTLKGLFK